MKPGIEQSREVDECQRDAFLVEKFGLWWIELHVLIACGNYTVKTAQLNALSLHILHASAEIKDQIIAKPIGNLHAPLKGVSLSRSEDDVHLLVCEMVLEEFLVVEAVCGACDQAHIQSFYQDLHGHYRVWV